MPCDENTMKFNQLDDKVYVYGQIDTADIAEISARGFRGIICNRPDGEADDQPDFDDIQDAATRLGLGCSYVPYLNGALTPKLLARLRAVIDATDGPVLMYCRSGRRSTTLWQAVRGPSRLAAE